MNPNILLISEQGALPALTVSRDVDGEDNEEEMEFLAEVGNSITKEEILELLERIPELDYTTAMVSNQHKLLVPEDDTQTQCVHILHTKA